MYHCGNMKKQTRASYYIHQIKSKSRKVSISTVDTDSIVMALSKFYELSTVSLEKLWVELVGKLNWKWIAVRWLAHSLSLPKCVAFPSWYGLAGWDTVSSFHGKRKKSAWETLKCDPKATEIFLVLSNPLDRVFSDNSISAIERINCLTYNKTTFFSKVNDCLRRKGKLSITCRQLKMIWFSTLKGKYTRVGKIVTKMLRYIFCSISLAVVFLFQVKRQTLYTHPLYLHS